MSWVITPSYARQGVALQALAAEVVGSVLQVPIQAVALGTGDMGDPVLFEQGALHHSIPVPVPRLPGLTRIEVSRAGFRIASAAYEHVNATAASPGNGAVSLAAATAGDAQVVNLLELRVQGLSVPPVGDVHYRLRGSNATTVYWETDEDDGSTISTTSSPGGTVHDLHFMIQATSGGSAAPPSAAAPAFPMPGGGALYGPALGAARLDVFHTGGRVDASFRLLPAQAMAACQLFLGTPADRNPLPNEAAAVEWSAQQVEARFDLRPVGVSVNLSVPDLPAATVSRFDSDPGARAQEVDFAPAARAVLADAYATAHGADLGARLDIDADAPCALHLQLSEIGVRYVHEPLPGAVSVATRGAPEAVKVPVPPGLRPQGLSFRMDGRFGPARLSTASPSSAPASREGFRVAGARQMACRLDLNARERTLPLARLGLYGRASEPGELLLTRHAGDARRIGPRRAEPVAIALEPTPQPRWHRAEVPQRQGLPPHPETEWVVVQASRGVFWWHMDVDVDAAVDPDAARIQRSEDAGAAWTAGAGAALVQAWVLDVDPHTGESLPVFPVSLSWPQGLLNADVVGGGRQSPQFTRLWVAQGSEHGALLDGIPTLAGDLSLHVGCRRDLDLSLSDLVLTYDPWSAEVA